MTYQWTAERVEYARAYLSSVVWELRPPRVIYGDYRDTKFSDHEWNPRVRDYVLAWAKGRA